MTLRTCLYALIAIGALVSIFHLGIVMGYITEPAEEVEQHTGLCEIPTNGNGDFTIVEQDPGNYEYLAVPTSQGIKIFRHCE